MKINIKYENPFRGTFNIISSLIFAQEGSLITDTLEVSLDITQIQQIVKNAPIFDLNQNRSSKKQISIPTLDGKTADFYVYETISMEEPLYSKFPSIRSYIIVNTDDPNYRGRLSTGNDQIHIMTRQDGEYEFIEPNKSNKKYNLYLGSPEKTHLSCGVDEVEKQIRESQNRSAQTSFTNGTTLRTYRIAIATTGEFYQAQGNNNTAVLAKINNYLNLLNDIYEDELAAHFNLIGNNTAIMFSDPATDGLDPSTVNTQLNTTQTVINNTIGSANYDIGHAFYTVPGGCCSGSGVASLGILCSNNFKARGWTGATSTSSDALWMGLFAHEIGHQFGATHSMYGTASNCVQRSPGNAYEPGSGNSLMSYEGICGIHNITPEVSTFYFHNNSLDQMIAEMNANSCHTSTATSNSVPVTTAPVNKTIPRGTPFELEGSATELTIPKL